MCRDCPARLRRPESRLLDRCNVSRMIRVRQDDESGHTIVRREKEYQPPRVYQPSDAEGMSEDNR